ncbi:MAG: PIG-L family deacetylase [Acidimicrobiia bacterium]
MIELRNVGARWFVPDGAEPDLALERTTHMGLGAHPDDLPLIALHGIDECFDADDRWFLGVTVTDGAGSPRSGRYIDHTDAEMARVRAEEEEKAARLGGYGAAVLLGYRSFEVKTRHDSLVGDLITLLEAARPRVVYTHNLADRHDTHVGVTLAAIDALRAMPRPSRPESLFGVEVWGDLDWLAGDDKVVFDLSGREGLATRLVGVYDSQLSGGKRYDRGIAGRWMAHATFSESHHVDRASALSYAMDLTPLVEGEIDPVDYIDRHVDRLRTDLVARIERLGG